LDEPGPYDKPKRKSTFNPELANTLNQNKAEEVEQQVGRAKDGLKKVNSPETKKESGFTNTNLKIIAIKLSKLF